MNPLEELGLAIRAGDLDRAAVAYKALTGKSVAPRKTKPKPVVKPKKTKPAAAEEVPVITETSGAVILVPEPTANRTPTPQTNRFQPGTAELGATHSFDAKVLPKSHVSSRDRATVTTQEVSVTCDGCGSSFQALAHEVNRRVDDERMKNFCNRCIRERCGV